MLDKRMEMMLQVASMLDAEDLDYLRGASQDATEPDTEDDDTVVTTMEDAVTVDEQQSEIGTSVMTSSTPAQQTGQHIRQRQQQTSTTTVPRGEYERQRTRESKISTVCVGREREKHDWWPVGTDLVGHMGSESFTAMVVDNAQVKSGRSILITSGAASGKVCMTPTRAAIEATENYRKANNLGRGGGVTNGWEFWKART